MFKAIVVLLSLACGVAAAQTRPTIQRVIIPQAGGNTWYAYGAITVPSGVAESGAGQYLLRSDDAGRNWVSLYVSPMGQFQYVNNMTVHPERTQLLYAVRSRARGGVYRSVDGGRTWTNISEGLPAVGEIVDVALLAGATETARGRIGDELYGFDGATLRWSKVGNLPAGTSALTFDPVRERRGVLVAGTGVFHVTTDGGATWRARGPLAPQAGNRFAVRIQMDARDENLILVQAESRAGGDGRCAAPGAGVFRSIDGGANFTVVIDTNTCNVSRRTEIDPVRPNVYANYPQPGFGYCVSRNRGETFECPSTTGRGITGLSGIHPRTGELFSNGMLQSSVDGATTFSSFSARMTPTLATVGTSATLTEDGSADLLVPLLFTDLAIGEPYLRYSARVLDTPWLTLANATGEVGPNTQLRLRVDPAKAVPGNFAVRVEVQVAGTANPTAVLNLAVTVTPRPVTGVRYRFERLMGGVSSTTPVADNVPAIGQPAGTLSGAARDGQGNVYVFANGRLRKIDTAGRVTTVAGDGTSGTTADGTPAAQAKFSFVGSIGVGRDGAVYIAESTGMLLYAVQNGVVRVVVDRNTPGISRFASLRGMCVSPSGTVYVNDGERIFRAELGKPVETVAGYSNFAVAANVSLFDCAAESDSSWVMSAPLSNRIYRWNSGGLTLVAGNGASGFGGDGGAATQATLNSPRLITSDTEGNLVFLDSGNSLVRVVRPEGRIYTVSGRGFTLQNTGLVADVSYLAVRSLTPEPNGGLLVGSINDLQRWTRVPYGTPVLQSNSAVNGASQVAGWSPGALVSIYGADLALDTRAASFSPLTTTLAGAEMLLNGRPMPIVFASATQVNAQVPPSVAIGPAKLRARVDGKQSVEIDVMIERAAPGIFVYGNNRAVAQNQDGAINQAERGEAPGRYGVLYATGLGATDNPVEAGVLSPASPLARATQPVELRIGDSVATVLFAGMTPGFIGLAQVNFVVPELEPGDYPMELTVGGKASNRPLFTVRAVE